MVRLQDYSLSGPFSRCRGKLGACGKHVIAAVSELCKECQADAAKVVAEVKQAVKPKPAPPAPPAPAPAPAPPVEVKHVGATDEGSAGEHTT